MSETLSLLRRFPLGLSGRLLVLTVFFVMVAEAMILAPSVARYRKTYLEEHIARGHLASLALEATADHMVSGELEEKLLDHAGAYSVALKEGERKLLVLRRPMPPGIDASFNLDGMTFFGWLRDGWDTVVQDANRVLMVMGYSPRNPDVMIEIVIDEAPMRDEMLGYAGRILTLSVIISFSTAGLVFLSLQWLMVRPMRHITGAMIAFRQNPEDEATTLPPSERGDEIGVAQRELAAMQQEVRGALRQKGRLATLGAAVAKVNHDLRNSLATAVLASDKLTNIEDPEVQKVAPRLYDAIDRAVSLCSQTLNYVSDSEPILQRDLFHLSELIDEVRAALRHEAKDGSDFKLRNEVPFETSVSADRQHLFRVLANLGRNARQAGATTATIRVGEGAGGLVLDVVDDGPGLPPKARDKLFQPFAGSARKGGTGLGLVISQEIMRAHGGDIQLVETGEAGTTFRLTLPG